MAVRSKDVHVGDVVCLENDDVVPCDAVLLATDNPDHSAFVETSNLDGETSLKRKTSASLTQDLAPPASRLQRELTSFFVECENPNTDIGSFVGNLHRVDLSAAGAGAGGKEGRREAASASSTSSSTTITLSIGNLLPRGTRIKKTGSVFAVCVYSGQDTKLSLNTKIVRQKFSKGERSLNIFFVVFFTIYLLETIALMVASLFYGVNFEGRRQDHDYMDNSDKEDADAWIIMFLVWALICNYIIPISMYFSLEAQKMATGFLYGWDLDMYDRKRDVPAKCSNSDIPEDLGQVTHIFTDKTGTLTRGDMVLQEYTLDGKEKRVELLAEEDLNHFVVTLFTCHNVDVRNGGYIGMSPDEVALVKACKDNGIVLLENTADGLLKVDFHGKVQEFRRLKELAFDSERKCMSVVIKRDKIYVYCKGAETVLFRKSFDENKEAIGKAVRAFSERGNRILVYGYKEISEDEFATFQDQLAKKESDVTSSNREHQIRKVYDRLEDGFKLTGATSIEDKLQQGVPDTISSLKEAGIIIWMLTGDKTETALAIARSAHLVRQPAVFFSLVHQTDLESALSKFLSSTSDYSTVVLSVDGPCVDYMVECRVFRKKLYDVIRQSQSVIASRLSPIQKSHLVHLVKKTDPDSTILAIGDGGNDVSMIQEAHLGIGIVGKEGTAASRAGDFSFSQFRFLKKTVLVHGHWNYQRLSYLLQHSFYKSVAPFTCMVYFGLISNFSGNALYDTFYLIFYNMIFSSAPILIYSVTEQVYSKKELMEKPALYKKNAHNKLLSLKRLFLWIALALYHSVVVFWGVYFLSSPHWSMDQRVLAHTVAGILMVIIYLTLLLDTKYWNVLLLCSIVSSLIVYIGVTLAYTEGGHDDTHGSYLRTITSSNFWVLLPLLAVVATLPKYSYVSLQAIVDDVDRTSKVPMEKQSKKQSK